MKDESAVLDLLLVGDKEPLIDFITAGHVKARLGHPADICSLAGVLV